MKKQITIPLLILLIIVASTVFSLPRLSLEQNSKCQNCHINPNGGGMRNEFGNYSVSFNELVLPQTKKYFLKHYKSPRISEAVTIGLDSRYLILESGRIFRMQTDAFLNFEFMKYLNYQIRFGEDPFGKSGLFESYALLKFDNKSFLKLGRFAPAFGLHTDDHKSYIRERNGYSSNVYLDGLSISSEFNNTFITTEFFNPNNEAVFTTHLYHLNRFKQFGFMAGLSYRVVENRSEFNSGFQDSRAIFGGINYDRFSVLGEIDFSGESSDTLIAYLNFTSRIEYGLYLIGEYNFFDPNRDVKNGYDENYKLSIELYPMPFIQFRPTYIFYTSGVRDGQEEYFFMFHVGY